jgi:hypothetical protein
MENSVISRARNRVEKERLAGVLNSSRHFSFCATRAINHAGRD